VLLGWHTWTILGGGKVEGARVGNICMVEEMV